MMKIFLRYLLVTLKVEIAWIEIPMGTMSLNKYQYRVQFKEMN